MKNVWTEHGFVEKYNLAARGVQFVWHVLQGASAFEIKKHVQKHLNGQTPESFDEGIIVMSMFIDTEWTKKGNTETCLHNAKEVAAFSTQFKPGHWYFLGPRQKNTWWNGNPHEPTRKMRYCRIVDGLTHSSVILPTRCVSSDRAIIAWTVEEPFPRYIRKQEDCHQYHFGKQSTLVFTIEFASGMRLSIRIYAEKIGRRRAHRSRTRAVNIGYAKTAKRATSSRRLDATIHRVSRDAGLRSFRTGIIFQKGGKWTILHDH